MTTWKYRTLKPFDAEATCPKCGHGEVSTTYVEEIGTYSIRYAPYSEWPSSEHLRRSCCRCSYQWPERPTKKRKRAASALPNPPDPTP